MRFFCRGDVQLSRFYPTLHLSSLTHPLPPNDDVWPRPFNLNIVPNQPSAGGKCSRMERNSSTPRVSQHQQLQIWIWQRGIPYMTSTTCWHFLTPSPSLSAKSIYCLSTNLGYCFLPPPFVLTSYMGAPKIARSRKRETQLNQFSSLHQVAVREMGDVRVWIWTTRP